VIGPNTLMAIQSSNAYRLKLRFNGHRQLLMAGLPNWDANSEGWARRIATNLLMD
jgi:lysozyme family protein